MKKFSIIAFILFGFLMANKVDAQMLGTPNSVYGPYKVYVSKKGDNPDVFNSGGAPVSADEGRVVDLKITEVNGPIKADPMEYKLEGPPCPTYDVHGNRTPKDVAPPKVGFVNGKISPDLDNIPPAGTSVDAFMKGQDIGWWTKCSKGEKVFSTDVRTVKYTVFSLLLTLEKNQVQVCKDEKLKINVTKRFPNDVGKVTWASQNGKFTISDDNNDGCNITGSASGDDVLIATFKVDKATYVEKVNVKVNLVKFKKNQSDIAWYNGGKKDAKELMTDNSDKKDLEWKLVFIGAGNGTATIDNDGMITYPRASGGSYTLTVNAKNKPDCKSTTKVVFAGFRLVLDLTKPQPCDGEEAKFHIVPVPANAGADVLKDFGQFKVTSEVANQFFGNEVNKNELPITQPDANFKGKVDNCIWYSTAAKGCNQTSRWKLRCEGKVNGVAVKSTDDATPPQLIVAITYNICINGSANVVQTFTGFPTIGTVRLPNGLWRANVTGRGNFRRNVKGQAQWVCNPNSQFIDLIKDEENYHVKQLEGNADQQLTADLWNDVAVMNAASTVWWASANPAYSQAMVTQGVLALVNAENNRSNSMFIYPRPRRCALEKLAKQQTGIKFGYHFPCAYPLCPQ